MPLSKCRSKYKCDDCQYSVNCVHRDHDTEEYMVHDELWPEGAKSLCVGCLETRLGRRLTTQDFTGAPINDPNLYQIRYAWSWRTVRLQGRLTGMDILELDEV